MGELGKREANGGTRGDGKAMSNLVEMGKQWGRVGDWKPMGEGGEMGKQWGN